MTNVVERRPETETGAPEQGKGRAADATRPLAIPWGTQGHRKRHRNGGLRFHRSPADAVPIYYLEGRKDAEAKQFSSTFTITYQNPQGAVLGGVTGYEAAVKNDFFQVIAYDGLTTPGTDNAIASELAKNPDYRRAAVVKENTTYHTGTYSIWARKSAPTTNPGKLIG